MTGKSTILSVLLLGSMALATPYGPYRERRPGTKGGSLAGISGGVGVGTHAVPSSVGAGGTHRIPGGSGTAVGIGAHVVTESPAAFPHVVTITDGLVPNHAGSVVTITDGLILGNVGTHGISGVPGGAGAVPHGASISSGGIPQNFPGSAGLGVADVHGVSGISGGSGLTASGITGGSGHIHLPIGSPVAVGDHGAVGGPINVGGFDAVGDHGAVGGPINVGGFDAVGDHGAVGGPINVGGFDAVGDHGVVGSAAVGGHNAVGNAAVGGHNAVHSSIAGTVDLREEDFGIEGSFNPDHYPDIVPGFPFQNSYPGRGFAKCPNWCRSSVHKNYYCCTRTSYKG